MINKNKTEEDNEFDILTNTYLSRHLQNDDINMNSEFVTLFMLKVLKKIRDHQIVSLDKQNQILQNQEKILSSVSFVSSSHKKWHNFWLSLKYLAAALISLISFLALLNQFGIVKFVWFF